MFKINPVNYSSHPLKHIGVESQNSNRGYKGMKKL